MTYKTRFNLAFYYFDFMALKMSLVVRIAFLFFVLSHVSPFPFHTRTSPVPDKTYLSLSEFQILFISPASSSCADAIYPLQCRTAGQVASAIDTSFTQYGVTSPGEMAAIISLVAFETEDFRYNINISPGRPGQGTRNMQLATFNLLYAQSIPALNGALAAITTGTLSSDLSSAQQNAIRDLLTAEDSLDFGSAAWFLSSQCSGSVRARLQKNDQDGWEAYMTDCVGTEPSDDRLVYWERAQQALDGAG